MELKVKVYFALCFAVSFYSCDPKAANKTSVDKEIDSRNQIELSLAQAKVIFDMPVHCLEIEYPNKLGQVLSSDADLKSPKTLRPIFYGCFDWHSSVHGYWSIIELLQKYPELDKDSKVRALLNKHITAENVAVEIAFFKEEQNSSFERTYGWAWLFKLQESLTNWQDPDAQKWKENLQPLADLLVKKYMEYLPKLVYPIRSGQHDNSAFGLSLSLDYARSVGDKKFEDVIVEHGKRLFGNDKNCNLAYEPSGSDFLSPCLEEAYFMSKIMDRDKYKSWLEKFMPSLFLNDFSLEPAMVKDRTDGKLIHLDGLNYSRAVCLYGISQHIEELAHLKVIADEHIHFSLPNLSHKDDYMGSHWLGTFALYALSHVN